MLAPSGLRSDPAGAPGLSRPGGADCHAPEYRLGQRFEGRRTDKNGRRLSHALRCGRDSRWVRCWSVRGWCPACARGDERCTRNLVRYAHQVEAVRSCAGVLGGMRPSIRAGREALGADVRGEGLQAGACVAVASGADGRGAGVLHASRSVPMRSSSCEGPAIVLAVPGRRSRGASRRAGGGRCGGACGVREGRSCVGPACGCLRAKPFEKEV